MLALAAVVAMSLAGCQNDNGEKGKYDVGSTTLAVKISGVKTTAPDLRSVEAPGATGELKVVSGTILIMDTGGNTVVKKVALDYATASTTGQVIADIPSNSSYVYVVANTTTVNGDLSNVLDEVKTVGPNSDYTVVPMANAGGSAVLITPAVAPSQNATVAVTLVPLLSRVELHSVRGEANMADNTDDDYVNITGFTVEGVYLDSYYPGFTLDGASDGVIVSEGKDTGFAIGDVGSWAAAAGVAKAFTAPDPAKVWAHNVVANGAPRFIVQLTNVTAEDKDGPITEIVDPADPTGDPIVLSGQVFWLSMNRTQPYNEMSVFERGKIYVIDELVFNSSHLFTIPNPDQFNLQVNVSVQDWVIEKVTANL